MAACKPKHLLNKSHDKLHGLCLQIVFNMIFEWLPHLCAPHIQLSVRSLSREGEFQTQIQPQRPGRFSNASQRRAPIGRLFKKGHWISLWTWSSYTLHFGWWINTPSHYMIQVSFLTHLPERKETAQEFPHEAAGDFKTVTELNGWARWKLRMDQHCWKYSTILT